MNIIDTSSSEIPNVLVISGPTASGKTQKAVEFCKKYNGEIISCDSRQVYKYLDVGTNKEGILLGNGVREINGILQHLTDIVDPDKTYSAEEFRTQADLKIKEIQNKGKIPVVVGGTGLYIKALLYGLDEMPKANKTLREQLKKLSQDELYYELSKLDLESAKKNKLNPQRLLRALEINIISGKTVKEHIKPKKKHYNFKHFSIVLPIEELYARINNRCKRMIENGMIDETRKILSLGFSKESPSLNGIGYRDIIKYLYKQISKEEMLLEFSKDTRHYAKRQNTWFRTQIVQNDIGFINGK
ncbi:MAG: tRNA (adenosine(37)-N6)-dimethylallyltransferase MiaA [Endomicrobium sp.]|jgi:tRNA dimethylallyltransferase|uniref:tRNA (adenosine(37)-N6)-dimethylallyltransferase MiaA n=1 Tax=Candidatus Endomicrobiellum cubanum TaxID=3242325 RepID=UPI002825743F|nr:tRNA (adenosine(37)-N6)-dimethylallyltransferase MiaA [Endomicrobium sp.]